jgi:hypothetical protein
VDGGASRLMSSGFLPRRHERGLPREVCEPLTELWHTGAMPTGRHTGHRAPSIADKARIARQPNGG